MTCVTCKYYKANACHKFSYLWVNPVSGKKELKGIKYAEKQRKYSGVIAFIRGECGSQGRFWCPTV